MEAGYLGPWQPGSSAQLCNATGSYRPKGGNPFLIGRRKCRGSDAKELQRGLVPQDLRFVGVPEDNGRAVIIFKKL
jgi:hypothetical protein